MLRSKFKLGEDRIRITKVIQTGGRHVNKDGLCKVYIEIISYYVNGTKKTKRIPTSVMVNPKNWDSKTEWGFVKKTDPDTIEKNTILNNIFMSYVVQLTEREQGTWNESFKPADLITINDMFPRAGKTLVNYLDDYIKLRENQNTIYNTLKNFKSLKGIIEKYEKHANISLKFEDINLTFSDNFYSYLLKKYSSGTIQKIYVRLITVLNYFYDRKDELHITLSDKFKNERFKHGKKSENLAHPISHQEFDILVKHTFKSEVLNKTKQRFLLQCSTGMRYSDVLNITPDKIIDNCIVYEPQKTTNKDDNVCRVPLNSISEGILKEYDYDSRKLKISNQKYNVQLESMFNQLNLDYPNAKFDIYTSHDARDTMISYSIEAGIDIPSLLKMVGQSNYDMMRRYFKNSSDHAKNSMKKVIAFS
jgi:hypothetical protein